MYAGDKVSAPGMMSLSGIIIAAFKFPFISKLSESLIYFFKNATFLLFFIFRADEFKYFFGILFLSSTKKTWLVSFPSYCL